MLILARGKEEGIVVRLDEQTLHQLLEDVQATGEPVLLRFGAVEIQGSKVRFGIDAPGIEVNRDEVHVKKFGDIPPFRSLYEQGD